MTKFVESRAFNPPGYANQVKVRLDPDEVATKTDRAGAIARCIDKPFPTII